MIPILSEEVEPTTGNTYLVIVLDVGTEEIRGRGETKEEAFMDFSGHAARFARELLSLRLSDVRDDA